MTIAALDREMRARQQPNPLPAPTPCRRRFAKR
jgi:hypothetical protein